MGLDYPRAWEITRASKLEDHDEKCSWRTHRMLCDCGVIYQHPEFLDSELHTAGGKVYEKPNTSHP